MYELTILEHHLDTFGHVNNATYLQILEEARWDILTKRNFGHDRVQELKLGPTILGINIQYRRELILRQKIYIETIFEPFKKRIGELHHVIKDKEGQIYCTADYKYGLFDMKTRKLIIPTPEWLAVMGTE